MFKFLKRIERNFLNKDKRTEVDFHLKGEVYKVLLLNRRDKRDLVLRKEYKAKTTGDMYEWLKPYIYKSFNLKELALKALDEGYIQTHLEVIEMLFEPEDIPEIIDFMIQANNLEDVLKCHQKD